MYTKMCLSWALGARWRLKTKNMSKKWFLSEMPWYHVIVQIHQLNFMILLFHGGYFAKKNIFLITGTRNLFSSGQKWVLEFFQTLEVPILEVRKGKWKWWSLDFITLCYLVWVGLCQSWRWVTNGGAECSLPFPHPLHGAWLFKYIIYYILDIS